MISASFAGNFTGDPEGREVGNSHVARFTVAVDDGYRDAKGEWKKNPVLFVNVEAWGSTARGVLAQMNKGSAVVVHGRWRAAEYEHEGQKRRRQYVVADAVGATTYAAAEATKAAAPVEGELEDSEEQPEGQGEDFWSGAK